MASEGEKKACTVTQAMTIAKRGLEQIRLTVMGEISELSDKAGYKAVYFTIRDDECAMSCLMWRDAYNASGIVLKPGMLVQVSGTFSCYPAKGRMQFSVRKLEMAGEGNLRMQVAQLAARLQTEGLMDPARKRRPPALPSRIAVITSPRGKAIRDVIRTMRRRYPLGELMVYGVPVEGADAPRYMTEALMAAQASSPAPEVILLVRGGGSYEDLMPFNDEGLARAVAACTIPVVTGIGHEPDNSIADMVADLRCSTPTAAAEAVAMSVAELAQKVSNATEALDRSFAGRLEALRHRLDRIADRPLWFDAHYLTGTYQQTLDALGDRLPSALSGSLVEDKATLALLEQQLGHALPSSLAQREHSLDLARQRLLAVGSQIGVSSQREIAIAAAQLDSLSPLKTLARGYSITRTADGVGVVDTVAKAQVGQGVIVQLQDGDLKCSVDAVEKREDRS